MDFFIFKIFIFCCSKVGCTTVAWSAQKKLCVLRACSVPVKAPQWLNSDFKGYEIKENCNGGGGGKSLINDSVLDS